MEGQRFFKVNWELLPVYGEQLYFQIRGLER
jgi:hypothetical protein